MNKTEFLSALERELSALPPEERRDAMLYYKEYFEEAGPENEEAAAHRLALRGNRCRAAWPRRQTGRRLPVNPPLQGLAPLQERVC